MPQPDLENKEETTETETSGSSASVTQQSTQKSTSKTDGRDWEKSYKGLQASSAKREQQLNDEIAKLKAELSDTNADLEGVRTDSNSLTTEKSALEERVQQLTTELEDSQDENSSLSNQLDRNKILMKEFPELAAFEGVVQPGADDDEYRANLKSFAENLDSYVQRGVAREVEGASPDTPDTSEEVTGTDQDKAWNAVVKLAGDPEKADEYEAALEAWGKIAPEDPDQQ